MNGLIKDAQDNVLLKNAGGSSQVVLVCEHASSHIPAAFGDLGLAPAARKSHAVWDPGAMDVAIRLSRHLDAPLVASGVSRLVYDCNRPPTAPDAMPARSEIIDVPGNRDLSEDERADRVRLYYTPFQVALRRVIQRVAHPVLVTVHSFTPIYFGARRRVEVGVLHDSDSRLADVMLEVAEQHTNMDVQRNAPYGPQDGVTHTLREHGLRGGHPNVMLEIRNDLIVTSRQQDEMGRMIAGWLADACAQLGLPGDVKCRA